MDKVTEIVRGTTNIFRVSIKKQDKTAYTLQAGDILRFGLKENYHRNKYLVKLEVGSEAEDHGEYLITLHPGDTQNLECKKYVYDIGLQIGSDYYMIVPYTELKLIPNITKFELSEEDIDDVEVDDGNQNL